MKKILNKTLLTIGAMGLAYYLYNPKKYNRMASAAKNAAGNAVRKGKEVVG